MTGRASVALALGALAIGCSPRSTLPPAGQLVVYLDTDAPLPGAAGDGGGALVAPPLFDRVRFDATPALDGGACDCSREFDVTTDLVASGAASFGVLPPLAGHGTLRVRLFRGRATVEGQPDPGSTIDITFDLPAVPSEGIVERTVFMPTASVGTPTGASSPVATSPGRPDPSRVGSWPGARRMSCPSPAGQGELCAPGGAFWMGNVAATGGGPGSGSASRLVVLSPFYIDAIEMTVGAYRGLHGQNEAPWSGRAGCDLSDYCTWTAAPGPNEQLPVNCVDWPQARAVCLGQGKDLPTEAQFEYVASGLAGQPFVWGTDVPECGDAVFERGGYGHYFSFPSQCVAIGADTTCGGAPAGGLGLGGPLPPRSGARDRLTVASSHETGTVFDLAGNVAEIARDRWDLTSGPCWSTPGVYRDPLCSDPAPTDVVTRGGDWAAGPSGLLAAARRRSGATVGGARLGFRCVREVR